MNNLCPYCRLEIPSDAKKCGHCQEWLPLGRWNLRSPTGQLFYIGVIVLITFVILRNLTFFFPIDDGTKKEFITGKTKISLSSSRVIRNGKRLYIVGEAKNDEKVKWSNIYITAAYFNKKGERIDQSYDLIHLKPGEKQEYQIEFHNFDKSDERLYDHYKVEVTGATNY